VTVLALRARRQVRCLLIHFRDRSRPEAQAALAAAVNAAAQHIANHPDDGLVAPRPYPGLARPGRAWIKSGRYWFLYSLTKPPVILALFHDTADISGRA